MHKVDGNITHNVTPLTGVPNVQERKENGLLKGRDQESG